jgi:double-stranded uracil-DNA glycosylase
VVGPGVRLLLVGINPGRRSAELGQHFAGPSNRFWPALHAAGLTPHRLDPSDQWELPGLGIGITNLVARASATAAEINPAELRAGGADLVDKVATWRPRVVAVLGVTAYRTAFGLPDARLGHQGGAWWVLPNPSGLNAHARPADHTRWLREVAGAAGLL